MKRKQVALTKARAAYAANRSTAPQFKGSALRPPAGVAERYAHALSALTAQMTAQVKREIVKLFQTDHAIAHFGVAMDAANVGPQARILVNSLSDRFNALFARKARDLATGMADGAQAASKTALHASLKQMTGGLSLQTSLMTPQLTNVYAATVAENVGLIKSIASDYLQKVQGAVMRSITTGNGLQDLVPAIEEYEGQTHRRALNIALDQTRKAYNGINRGRMQGIGVKRFQWIHSGGGAHPREDHVAMDGEVFSFDNLPVIDPRTGERGIPGQAPNCKCTMAPVFDFEDDEGEPKAGYGGRIPRANKGDDE